MSCRTCRKASRSWTRPCPSRPAHTTVRPCPHKKHANQSLLGGARSSVLFLCFFLPLFFVFFIFLGAGLGKGARGCLVVRGHSLVVVRRTHELEAEQLWRWSLLLWLGAFLEGAGWGWVRVKCKECVWCRTSTRCISMSGGGPLTNHLIQRNGGRLVRLVFFLPFLAFKSFWMFVQANYGTIVGSGASKTLRWRRRLACALCVCVWVVWAFSCWWFRYSPGDPGYDFGLRSHKAG